jgi:hypothetical protein
VSRGDLVFGGEIGDGARQLQHPVVSAGGESHLAHSRTEQRLGGIVEGGILAQLLGTHVGVGQECGAGEAPRLDLPRTGDALLDGRGSLTRPPIRKLLVRDARHVEMDVDAVQQWPTDPLLDKVVNWGPRDNRTQTLLTVNATIVDSTGAGVGTRSWLGHDRNRVRSTSPLIGRLCECHIRRASAQLLPEREGAIWFVEGRG